MVMVKALVENASKMNIDVSKVDTVVISHGHKDHGGGLKAFMAVNHTAKIYLIIIPFAVLKAQKFMKKCFPS